MKWILGFLICASSFAAHATPWTPTVFEKQRVTYKIERRELSFENDRYRVDVKTLCQGSLNIDALDFRNPPPDASWPQMTPIECKVVVDGRERIFYTYINSAVLASWGTIKYDTKSYALSMWFFPTDQQPETIPQGEPNSARTRQLDLRNMILETGAPQGITCFGSDSSGPNKITKDFRSKSDSDRKCEVMNPVIYTSIAEFETL